MVLLILVLVWAAVLGPSLLRRRFQQHSTDSIGAFHRQLRVLQRTGPTLVDPLHRLDTTLPSAHVGHRPVGNGRKGLIVVRPDTALPVSPPASPASYARRPDPFFRPEACKRRREVLLSLVVCVVVTGMMGIVPSIRPVFVVTAIAAVALAGYVMLLIKLRTRALEREHKLRYLPQPEDREAPLVARRMAAR